MKAFCSVEEMERGWIWRREEAWRDGRDRRDGRSGGKENFGWDVLCKRRLYLKTK